MRGSRVIAAALGILSCFGCAKHEDVVVKTGSEQGARPLDLDKDPLALLPDGAAALVYVDAQKLFASEFGAKVLALTNSQLPIPPGTGFEPKRDLSHVYVGLYSMQGLDVAGVATGSFDQAAIERDADQSGVTPLGAPIVRSSYAGRTLFTTQNAGFAVLTSKTVLFGNETGIRRSLDRIEARRVRRQLPSFMKDLLDQPKAPLIAGADLRSQAITDSLRGQFKFLNGLSNLRLLGNFEPPGINFAGTLGYDEEAQATEGAESLRTLEQTLQSYGWIMSLLGITQPIRQLQAEAKGKEAYVVIGVDGRAVGQLLDQVPALLPRRTQPTSAPAAP